MHSGRISAIMKRKVSLLTSKMPANMMAANRKRYINMDSKPIPAIMTGIAKRGIKPKEADERSPYRKPLSFCIIDLQV